MQREDPVPTGPTLDEICALSRPSLEQRLAMLRREFVPRVLRREPLPDGVRWQFPDEPEQRAKLERLIALEQACCGGLRFSLERDAGLWLCVRGVDPAAPFFEQLFASAAAPPRGRLARLAGAGGIGVAASFFAFCVLPLGVAALAGAAAAAPLAGLESPLTLAAGAAAGALAAWFWLGRRRRMSFLASRR